MTRRAVRVAAAVVTLACVAATTRESPDAEAARAAYAAYTTALAAGDLATAKTLALADADHAALLNRVASALEVERRFRAAVDKAFPNALPPAPATRPASATVKIDADAATLTPADAAEPVRLRRTDAGWKVDLNAMYPAPVLTALEQYGAALRDTMDGLTADVVAGKFKAYADVQGELETRIKMRLANPEDFPTSRPTSRPTG